MRSIKLGRSQPGRLTDWNYYVELDYYPDGLPLILENNIMVNSMLLRPTSLDQFVAAMFYCDASRERGLPITNLVIPHVPGGRQDRLNSTGDYLFTLKSVAKMINDRNFDSVTVVDPHSMVTPALIDRCKVVTSADIIRSHAKHSLSGYDGVIAPDAGAAKRAFDVSQVLGVEFFQAEKHRDVTTGKLSGFYCPPLPGQKYLVVDDICDGGGTFLGLANELASQSVEADLFVTHGIFSQGTDKLLEAFDQVFTTDSTAYYKHDAIIIHAIERL